MAQYLQKGMELFEYLKQKAKAFLIRNFLELAANPHYIDSQFLSRIYRHRILGEDITSPPLQCCISYHYKRSN